MPAAVCEAALRLAAPRRGRVKGLTPWSELSELWSCALPLPLVMMALGSSSPSCGGPSGRSRMGTDRVHVQAAAAAPVVGYPATIGAARGARGQPACCTTADGR